jgi:hypothetical protein
MRVDAAQRAFRADRRAVRKGRDDLTLVFGLAVLSVHRSAAGARRKGRPAAAPMGGAGVMPP